jgi:menaquinone-specific isochorismate synthase
VTPPDGRLATLHGRLVARTELLPDGEQLLDHLAPDGAAWLHDGRGFVTAGIAAVVDPADAVGSLRAIDHLNAGAGVGAPTETLGPRAIGALPFAGGGRMIVPASIVERADDGRLWRTEIAPAQISPSLPIEPTARTPGNYTITRVTGPQAWEAEVSAVLALIAAGAAEKVVLAREVVITGDVPFDIPTVVETLLGTQPGCIVYADNGFVGASPELLVRRSGREVTARPMAGTSQRADDLLRSEKDAREHRYVVDAVLEALAPTCEDEIASGPAPIGLADLTHLATMITARVRDLDTSALDLALALHPTPAVAGTPRSTALAAIARLEPTARDLYAGPCGWVDANGDGEFVVALRGAQIEGTQARLHAGAGIVAGSRAVAEWAETQSKLEPMLRALIRP